MPKIQLPPNLKKLKEQLETGHNLVDHFLVCGIPPSTCLQDFLYDDKNDKYKEIFKENIKPSIISRFPEFDNSIDSIDDEIINYCFPEGFNPVITSSKGVGGKIFSVILDNNLFSAEHPQKYLSCLLFYEKLSLYKDLKSKLEKQKDILDIEEVEEEEIENEQKLEIKKFKSQEEKKEEKENDIIPKNKIFSSVIFPNKDENNDNNNLKPNSGNIKKTFLKRSSFISETGNVFIPKCICLVSIHPFIKLFQNILSEIYQYISKEREIPIEKIITNLIIEVPNPPRGLYSINYSLMGNEIILEGTENNKIQVISQISLKKFNSRLDFKIKLEVIKHILLCSKILFFSTDLNNLCETILSFLVLIFPFKYPFQVTSYLHKDSYNILESISPFMIGINEHYSIDFFESNDITTDGMNIFVVDLDKKTSQLISDEEFPNFPSKILSSLEKEIKNLESKFKKDNDSSNMKEFNEPYQTIFFEFFCEMLKGYENYLNMDYFKSSDQDKVTSIETLFQCPKFIQMHNNSEFYQKFIDESQLFADFIYKRMIPRNNQELLDVLLVNETNIRIRNRQKYFGAKENTDFLNSDEYNLSNKYIVPMPRKLTNEEISAINSKKDLLLNFGQKIKNNDDNKELIFSYSLFPQLNFQIYCNNDNVNDYFTPQDYSEEIEAINSDLLSKSSIGQSINLSLEMKNNLYLTWLEIWAYTFWYVDKEERKFRFDQMLDILDKVIHHEMNIFNLMFEVLNQENEQKMIVKLYQKLLKLKINPSTFIYNIISNRLDKDEIKVLFDEMKSGKNDSLKFGEKIKNSSRTLLFKSDKPSLINKKLSFDAIFYCIDCGEEINLLKLCENFEGIKNDILWAPCQNGDYNLPKIKVNFGLELFPMKYDDNNITTSVKNEIVLHSPYNLKINIKNAVNNRYGIKLKVNEFKSHFCTLFWNFIWYCSIYKLDYDILLPYAKKIEQERANRTVINPNNDKIKLVCDNDLFKKNEEKLSKIDFDNVGQDSGNSIVEMSTFKILEEENAISIEIQKSIKTKNKKLVSKFINHLEGKSFSVCEINKPALSKISSLNQKNEIRGSGMIQNGKTIKK